MNYDRVILELLDRVSALEDEIINLKRGVTAETEPPVTQERTHNIDTTYLESRRRDSTKYSFRNRIYGKNRLVLAVVQAYFNDNLAITANELVLTFDKKIQGSLGVVRKIDDLKRSYPDFHRRFFVYSDEVIHTKTGDCVVCSQWGKFNIDAFISRASELGYVIEQI